MDLADLDDFRYIERKKTTIKKQSKLNQSYVGNQAIQNISTLFIESMHLQEKSKDKDQDPTLYVFRS